MKTFLTTIKHMITRHILLMTFIILIVWIFGFECISSGSMSPTLPTHSIVITLSTYNYIPNRGDIISFRPNNSITEHEDYLWLKRVIGIPGDTIEFKDNEVYLNGELLVEDYLSSETMTYVSEASNTSFTVPEGKLFVMGDNRLGSYDSRLWDDPFVSIDDVVGIYLFTLYNSQNYSDFITKDQCYFTIDVDSLDEIEVLPSELLEAE